MVQFVRNCNIPEPPECVVSVPPFKPITPNISDTPHEFPTALVTKLLPCNKKDRFPCPDFVIDNADCLNTYKLETVPLLFQEGNSTINLNEEWEASITVNIDMEAHCCDDEEEDHDEVVVSPIIDIELPGIKIPCATMRFEDTIISESSDTSASLDFTVEITPETCSELVVTPSLKFPKPCVTTIIARVYLLSLTAYEEVIASRDPAEIIEPGKITGTEFLAIRALPFDANNEIIEQYNDFIWFACIFEIDREEDDSVFIEKILAFDPFTMEDNTFYCLPVDTLKGLADADKDDDSNEDDQSNENPQEEEQEEETEGGTGIFNRLRYALGEYLYWSEGDFISVRFDMCTPDVVELNTTTDRYQMVIGEIHSDCAGDEEEYATVTIEVTSPKRFAGTWDVAGNYTDPIDGSKVTGVLDLKTEKVYTKVDKSEEEITVFQGTLAGITPPYTPGPVINCIMGFNSTAYPLYDSTIVPTESTIGVMLPPGTPVTVEVHHTRCGSGDRKILKDYSLPMYTIQLAATLPAGAYGWSGGYYIYNATGICQPANAFGFIVWMNGVWNFFAPSSSEDTELIDDGECDNDCIDVHPGKKIYINHLYDDSITSTRVYGMKLCDVNYALCVSCPDTSSSESSNETGSRSAIVNAAKLTADEKKAPILSDNYSTHIDTEEGGIAELRELVGYVYDDKVYISMEQYITGNGFNYDIDKIAHDLTKASIISDRSFSIFDTMWFVDTTNQNGLDGVVSIDNTTKQYTVDLLTFDTTINQYTVSSSVEKDVPYFSYNSKPVISLGYTNKVVYAPLSSFDSSYRHGELGSPCETDRATVSPYTKPIGQFDYGVITWSGTGIELQYNPQFEKYSYHRDPYTESIYSIITYDTTSVNDDTITLKWMVTDAGCCDEKSIENYRKYGHYALADIPDYRNSQAGQTYDWEPSCDAEPIIVLDFDTGSKDTLRRINKRNSLKPNVNAQVWTIQPNDWSCCLIESENQLPFQWEYVKPSGITDGNTLFDRQLVFKHYLSTMGRTPSFNASAIDFLIGDKVDIRSKAIFKPELDANNQPTNNLVMVDHSAYGMDIGEKKTLFSWKPNDQRAITTTYTFKYYSISLGGFTGRKKEFSLRYKTHYPIVIIDNEYAIQYGKSTDGYYVYDREANAGCEIDKKYTWTLTQESIPDKTFTFDSYLLSNYVITSSNPGNSNSQHIINPNNSTVHYWVADETTENLLSSEIVFEPVSGLETITLTCSIEKKPVKAYAWILEK